MEKDLKVSRKTSKFVGYKKGLISCLTFKCLIINDLF